MKERFGLNGNVLKIIAAISMFIDHMGFIFFPQVTLFRIIGRIALPIYAFMIAEGCRYTRNKIKYFLTVFLLATVCQVVYFVYDGDTYMSILVTFSISILNIYALQLFKESLFKKAFKWYLSVLFGLLFVFSITSTYISNLRLEIDYGFYGCMLPVFASLLHPPKNIENKVINKLDNPILHVVTLSIGMLLLALESGGNQFWSFLAIPFLLLYSGKRGRLKMKYFFYVFYPAHLLLLELINMII